MRAINLSGKHLIINFIFLILALNCNSSYARKVQGYIIDNNSDTITGKVKISGFDLYARGFVLTGINLEPLYSCVKFKRNDTRGFQNYYPQDISKFGFLYDSNEYIFERFIIESKSIINSDRLNDKFLNLIHKGNIALYRNFTRANNPLRDDRLNDISIEYYDYYLYNAKNGLTKVEISKDFESLIDLLKHYDLEEEFLGTLPKNIRIGDIPDILIEYDLWKSRRELKI